MISLRKLAATEEAVLAGPHLVQPAALSTKTWPAEGLGPPFGGIDVLAPQLQAADNDNRPSDELFDQYYTREDVAERFWARFNTLHDPRDYLMVEPSGGAGAFFRLLPPGSLGYDVEPKYPGIQTADFLTVEVRSDKSICFIGNPPFGRNASMAVRFFNHSATYGSLIALILPRSFRKASVQNRLDTAFHPAHDEVVPANAFLFRNRPYNVPAVFQIWERRDHDRPMLNTATHHPDFEFTHDREAATFVIQRVGARAGRVHHDFGASLSSHLFIKGDVEHIMRKLDLQAVAGNVAGNPSVCKSEIVSMYQAYVARHGRG